MPGKPNDRQCMRICDDNTQLELMRCASVFQLSCTRCAITQWLDVPSPSRRMKEDDEKNSENPTKEITINTKIPFRKYIYPTFFFRVPSSMLHCALATRALSRNGLKVALIKKLVFAFLSGLLGSWNRKESSLFDRRPHPTVSHPSAAASKVIVDRSHRYSRTFYPSLHSQTTTICLSRTHKLTSTSTHFDSAIRWVQ